MQGDREITLTAPLPNSKATAHIVLRSGLGYPVPLWQINIQKVPNSAVGNPVWSSLQIAAPDLFAEINLTEILIFKLLQVPSRHPEKFKVRRENRNCASYSILML